MAKWFFRIAYCGFLLGGTVGAMFMLGFAVFVVMQGAPFIFAVQAVVSAMLCVLVSVKAFVFRKILLGND